MCVNPKFYAHKGMRHPVECRKCWQCKENRINDWVGRCIAESKDCVAATVVTLTYGNSDRVHAGVDDLAAKVLDYSDIEKWLKRLRSAGYPLRFFLCGEYGDLKGRAHWHAICFWKERVPNYMQRVNNRDDKFWPHGYTYWDGDFTESAVGYVCRYVIKRDGSDETSKRSELHMSRNPPLGTEFFERRAKQFADQRLLPQDAFYSFPEIRDKKTRLPRQFLMTGAVKRDFLNAFIYYWERKYGEHPLDYSHSDFLLDHLDRMAARETTHALERRVHVPLPFMTVPEGFGSVQLDDKHNAFYTLCADTGEILYWSFDKRGKRAWQDVIRTETEAARMRADYETSRDPQAYRRGRDGGIW